MRPLFKLTEMSNYYCSTENGQNENVGECVYHVCLLRRVMLSFFHQNVSDSERKAVFLRILRGAISAAVYRSIRQIPLLNLFSLNPFQMFLLFPSFVALV